MENETSDVQPKCQGPLQLLSPPFLMMQHHKTDAAKRKGDVSTRVTGNTPYLPVWEHVHVPLSSKGTGRTSIFDQLSALLTDSPCGCFFDPRVIQRRYSSF